MTDRFVCDFDGSSEIEVSYDNQHVEVSALAEPFGGLVVTYLTPERARELARAVTLASFAVEGHEVEVREMSEPADDDPDEPIRYGLTAPRDRIGAFMEARTLAGDGASLKRILAIARYLAGDEL